MDQYVIHRHSLFSPDLPHQPGWITYATAGIMQGSLLIMCLLWKARQARLHIDDFGNKLGPDLVVTMTNGDSDDTVEDVETDVIDDAIIGDGVAERTPLLEDATDSGKRRGLYGQVISWWL